MVRNSHRALCVAVLSLTWSISLGRSVVDMTHTLDENAPKYPLAQWWPDLVYYKTEGVTAVIYDKIWASVGRVEFYEHYGTHMDAPSHFGNGRQTMSEIPPERLVGPGVVIDVKNKASANPNYAVTKQDLLDYEGEYGRIPPKAIVLMNSGWAKYYPDPVLYLGTTNLTDVTTLHFPGFGLDACEFLIGERQVSVVGVDTMSVDPGQPPTGVPYRCHVHLQPNNVPLLENVANLDAIPQKGTTIVLGGLKTKTGTGGPTRIFALIDDVGNDITDFAETVVTSNFILIVHLMAALYAKY